MISNLRIQLRKIGMEKKIEQTLEEAGRVRAEFGYPIMVTPLVAVRRQPGGDQHHHRRALQGSDRSNRFSTRSATGAKKRRR